MATSSVELFAQRKNVIDKILFIFGSFGIILSLFKSRFTLGIPLFLGFYVVIRGPSLDVTAIEGASCINLVASSAGWRHIDRQEPCTSNACGSIAPGYCTLIPGKCFGEFRSRT